MFNHIEIDDSVSFDLKRVNIIVTEGEIDKTAILESIFLPTLTISTYSDWHVMSYVNHVLKSRGDPLSAFSSLTDSVIKIDNNEADMDWYSNSVYEIEVNDVSEIDITIDDNKNKIYIDVDEDRDKEYTPVYISTSFYMYPIPEMIFSEAVLRNKNVEIGDWHILHVKGNEFRLHYKDKPVYSINKGVLKMKLIKLALAFSDLLLIDEIESSLDYVMLNDVLNEIKNNKNTQVIMTTFSDKVIKAFKDVDDAQVIFINEKGYKTYNMSEIKDYENPINWLGYA